MHQEAESRLEALVMEALCLETAQRPGFVARIRSTEEGMAAPLEACLARAAEAPSGFLDEAAFPVAPPESCEITLPPHVGPYRILERLGQGGMGVVYRALQPPPFERAVALKMIRAGWLDAEAAVRFRLECQTLARMQHPGIAQLLDTGTSETGMPYLVMELLEGEPILRYCERHALALDERLRLMAAVCRAVDHAHRLGVIHRDLKPSNVVVVSIDGKPVPKVIDFGIAKACGAGHLEASPVTQDCLILGTPTYMSPEQLRRGPLDIRTDVYSMGCLLFALLTGEAPFQAGSLLEVLRRTLEEPATRPSVRAGRSFGDLDWIALRALEKDPARRYASAREMAEDIDRRRRGVPVRARPPAVLEPLLRGYRRYRDAARALTGLSLALLLSVLGTSITLVGSLQAEAEARREAEANRQVNRLLRDMLASPNSMQQGREVRIGDVLDRKVDQLDITPPADPFVEGKLRWTLGQTYQALGEGPMADAQMARACQLLGAAAEECDGPPPPQEGDRPGGRVPDQGAAGGRTGAYPRSPSEW
jgi:serine/threonine protein kinase